MKRSTAPTYPADHQEPAPVLAPALARDMARMFRQLGVESFRASVVDMNSMAYQAAWTITDNGEVSDNNRERPLDSQFPGAMATISQLAHAPAETTVVQRLSPRRWTYAWRIDQLHVVIAEARYRDMRASVTHTDTALVRLVCDTGIRAGQASGPPRPASDDEALVWPATQDRRRRSPSPLAKQLALGLTITASLMALWMALVALPEAREAATGAASPSARLRAVADSTMVRGLAGAMATGDAAEVQAELGAFEQLGYFQAAVVVNPGNRIVSVAGAADGLRAGADLPPELARSARSLDLARGNQRYGRLLVLAVATAEPLDARLGAVRLAALVAFGCAAVAAALMLLRQRLSRRIGD